MENEIIKFKNIAIVAFLGFLALVILYSIFWGPAKRYMDSLPITRVVNVSAEGKVTISPDIAKFSFSVISEGTDPEILANNNNKNMNAAIDFVKSQGIDEKDIKTIQYDLSPRYEYDKERKKTFISGYTFTQTVLVKIRDLNKVAKVLGGLPELGINQISSISFEVDDPEKYLTEARDKAFEKAKEKAKEMAAQNGTNLGEVISFSEYGQPISYYGNYEILGKGGAAPTAPSIQPGTQEITVNVNVTYRIK